MADDELLETIDEEVEDEEQDEVLEDAISDSLVITVNIDDTLSISGDAADAKAVGDALVDKVDASDVKNSLSVNGRTGGGTWAITVNGDNIPAQSDADTESVADALARIDASDQTKAAASDVKSTLSVAGRTGSGTWTIPLNGTNIPVQSDADEESVAEAVTRLEGADSSLDGRVDDLEEHQGFSTVIEISEAGTITVPSTGTDDRITANHILTGYQFYDSNEAATADILANFTWTTGAGTLTVVVSRVFFAGYVRLNFGWRDEIEEVSE